MFAANRNGDRMKYQVFPELTPIEYEALKGDIAQRGVLVPIDVDEKGEILDGHHRVRAWNELQEGGIEVPSYPKIIRAGLTEEQKRNHARSLNVLRRQLSKDQRDQVMLDMRKDGMSYRQIAEVTGVSNQTVMRTIESTAPFGAVEMPDVITGKDGKQRQAKQRTGMFVPGDEVVIEPRAAEEAAKQIRAEKTEVRRVERKDRNDELCQDLPVLEGLPHRFDLIYADPPWRYEFSKTDSRVIENQYPTMALDDICAMPVGDIAIDNAVLFLWATMPKLEEALRVVNAWGFSYRTAIAWDKVRMGQGIYTRQQVELLLICIKGEMYSPESDFSKDFRSLVTIERSNTHSEKPYEFYDIIEGLYPDCTRIELFARNQRAGWSAFGNEATCQAKR